MGAGDYTLAFARRKSPGIRHRFSPLFISPFPAPASRRRNAISENRVVPRLFRSFHQARNRPPRLRAFRRRYIPQSPPGTHLVLSYMQYVTPLTATNAQAASIVKHMHLKQRDFGKSAPANSKRYPIYARVTHNPKSCGPPLP